MSYFPYQIPLIVSTSGNTHIDQYVNADTHNSSTTNLGGGAMFTGSSTSTLGVVGIQVSLKTDKNCTIYIDQSPDGTNWDISDPFNYNIFQNNFGVTVQAINSYVRVRVLNIDTTSTNYFRLQTVLCPIVEAIPRSLNEYGNLKTSIIGIKDNYGFGVENTPMDEMRVVEPFRLVGSTFVGSIIDYNFWITGTTAGGTVTQSGQMIFDTNTTPNGGCNVQSYRFGRYTGGSSNRFRAVIRLGDSGASNNYRRFGSFSSTDGCFFELSGTTLNVVIRKTSVDTKVPSSSWNGNTVLPTLTNVQTYEIYFTNSKVYFTIGGVLFHTVNATSTTWSDTLSLPIRIENQNIAGSTTNTSLYCRAATIYRLGKDKTTTRSQYLSSNGTYVLKYGPGILHQLTFGVAGSNSNTFNVYDSTGAAINQIASLDSASIPAGTNVFGNDLEFYNGLTIIVATGTAPKVTVQYE